MEENTLIQLRATSAVLQEYGEEVARFYREELDKDDRVASNALINSVEARIARDGQTYLVQLQLLDYWKYVEWDTKPHWPPPSALLQWIKVKPVLPRPDKNGRLPKPEQLAFLIGRKISRVGTKGSHSLEHTLAEVNARYEALIAEALAEDLGDTVHGWIIEYLCQ